MYKDHPVFTSIDDNDVIWRYMSLSKFCCILQTSSLFFSRPSNFCDPWEGVYPSKAFNKDDAEQMFSKIYDGAKPPIPKQNFIDIMVNQILSGTEFSIRVRNAFGINCWNIGVDDKEFLWKVYGQHDDCIAIVSTFRSLKAAFEKTQRNIFIGKVKYCDYNKTLLPTGNGFYPIMHKRDCYAYENELRAVIWEEETYQDKQKIPFKYDNGEYVEIDSSALIQKVVISPFCGNYLLNVVSDLLCKYGLSCKLEKSELLTLKLTNTANPI